MDGLEPLPNEREQEEVKINPDHTLRTHPAYVLTTVVPAP